MADPKTQQEQSTAIGSVEATDFDSLLSWQVDTCNACHSPPLALALLMFWIGADHPHHAMPLDNLAFVTHFFY